MVAPFAFARRRKLGARPLALEEGIVRRLHPGRLRERGREEHLVRVEAAVVPELAHVESGAIVAPRRDALVPLILEPLPHLVHLLRRREQRVLGAHAR